MSPAIARAQTARSSVERTNHEATAPPTVIITVVNIHCECINSDKRQQQQQQPQEPQQ